MNDGMYRVVSGGLWQPAQEYYNLNVAQIEETINGILERHENQTQEIERRMVLHTGPEGERQIREALRQASNLWILDETPQVSTGIFEIATPTISSGLGTIQMYGTGGANREYGEYVAGYDPYVPTGEEIRNSQSISTTRHFETEEEVINYLDSLSNDI
jgi:hypothetical protein